MRVVPGCPKLGGLELVSSCSSWWDGTLGDSWYTGIVVSYFLIAFWTIPGLPVFGARVDLIESMPVHAGSESVSVRVLHIPEADVPVFSHIVLDVNLKDISPI